MGKIAKSHVNSFEYTKMHFIKFFATYARGVVLTYMESEIYSTQETFSKLTTLLHGVAPGREGF